MSTGAWEGVCVPSVHLDSWDKVASDTQMLPGLRGRQGQNLFMGCCSGPAPDVSPWHNATEPELKLREPGLTPEPTAVEPRFSLAYGGETLLPDPHGALPSLAVHPTAVAGQLPKAPGRGNSEHPPPPRAGGSPGEGPRVPRLQPRLFLQILQALLTPAGHASHHHSNPGRASRPGKE